MESRQLIEPTTPSMTAFNIFMATWRSSKKYPHLFTPLEKQLLDTFSPIIKQGFPLNGPNGYRLNGMYYAPRQVTAAFMSNYLIPYYDDMVLIRKLMIKQWLHDKIDEGVEQVVVVGDGFDIRSLVVGLTNPAVTVFALDRSATRHYKTLAIQGSHSHFNASSLLETSAQKLVINGNIYYLDFDANQQTLADCLTQNTFDQNRKTAVLLEGFGMYVTREVMQSLLTSLNDLVPTPGHLKVLVSMMSKIRHTPLGENSLKNSKELYQSSLRPSEAIDFFKSFGDITGKFTACSHLENLGNEAGQEFIHEDAQKPDDQSMPHEHYYELTNTSDVNLINTIENVPELALPEHLAPKPTSSWCTVL